MHDKLSNKASKLIKSLQQKKYRDQHGLFVAEGVKLVGEALAARITPELLVYCGDPLDLPYSLPDNALHTSERDLDSISSLKNANRILAVFSKGASANLDNPEQPIFALDGVSDPGNLGTIIRLCDWFGMPQLICDERCVDLYNPKVVQSTMGSIFRVEVQYVALKSWLQGLPSGKKIYAAHMDGSNLFKSPLERNSVIVLGSEAHGISPGVEALCTTRISIPKLGGGESLNVAVSAAIFAAAINLAQS